MHGTIGFLLQHGYSILIIWIFAEQMGLPIPSIPLLLSAGALAGTGRLKLSFALICATIAAVIADLIWFQLGRRRGVAVLGFLCRISLEPDSCVSRTRDFYTKQGVRSLMIAKFVPGLNTVAPPLAGMARMKTARFLMWDALGSILWAGIFLGLGFVFSDQIERVAGILAGLRGRLTVLLATLISGYILYKYLARQRLLRKLRVARISAAELKFMLDRGEDPVIVDLRNSSELLADPGKIPGALHVSTSELRTSLELLPKDREIVLYCT